MLVTCQIDTRNLQRAQAVFLQYTRQVPAEAVNRTALFVIRDVQSNTPVVSQDMIDADMNVSTSPAVLLNGKLSTSKTRQHEVVAFGNRAGNTGAAELGFDKDDVSVMNTAYRIVLARMHPNSRYSQLTGNRWPVPIPDFGRGRGSGAGTDSISLFWAYVKDVATRMVRARHSSTGFLKQSWSAIIYKLLPYVPSSYRGGVRLDMGELGGKANFGEVKPALPGNGLAVCTVSNTMGMNNYNDVLSDKYNRAIHAICEPIVQKSIDKEFESKVDEAARRGWLERSSFLASCGVAVRVN